MVVYEKKVRDAYAKPLRGSQSKCAFKRQQAVFSKTSLVILISFPKQIITSFFMTMPQISFPHNLLIEIQLMEVSNSILNFFHFSVSALSISF